MSAAADRLERLACFYGAQQIVRLPELEARERDADLLRNVAALVRACEAKQEDMQNAGQDFYGDDILAALAKLQEGE